MEGFEGALELRKRTEGDDKGQDVWQSLRHARLTGLFFGRTSPTSDSGKKAP